MRLEGEIEWSTSSVVVPIVSFMIGVTSALLGIGGGELMGPVLLILKVCFLYTHYIITLIMFVTLSFNS